MQYKQNPLFTTGFYLNLPEQNKIQTVMDIFNQKFLKDLLLQAEANPRHRQHYDLRTSAADTSQRMLNALLPDTEVPIHKHDDTSETVVCLMGKLEEILYNENKEEISRHLLCPAEGSFGMQIPAGVWHTIRVLEPSVIFEAKDGAFRPRE